MRLTGSVIIGISGRAIRRIGGMTRSFRMIRVFEGYCECCKSRLKVVGLN